MVKPITHRKSAMRPLGKPCLHDKLPTASELLALSLDTCQFLVVTCCHLDRREAYPIDACHFEQLLVFDSQSLELFGDQMLQIFRDHLVECRKVPIHHP